ncbi:hypothetical protein NDU88_004183 [Pleurodeles waltl]|uniref:Uncharacterized protein n=1 Tax=Pleurodeles waltl TaxID=8319 RepID=A0AAV7NRS9_PLEWA|nr:hypothetical protein NDU88_004183 [Pleurodeles waltl]
MIVQTTEWRGRTQEDAEEFCGDWDENRKNAGGGVSIGELSDYQDEGNRRQEEPREQLNEDSQSQKEDFASLNKPSETWSKE